MNVQLPSCPRCGYDQSGAVAAWGRNEPPMCPLDGVCSECGLRFGWMDVFRPDLRLVRGFYEHARGPWQRGIWAIRTLWWALLPWRFWRRVALEHAPVPRRIVLWPLLVLVLLWAAGSLVSNATYAVMASWPSSPGARALPWPPPGRIGWAIDREAIANAWVWPVSGVRPSWLWGRPRGWYFDPLQWVRGGGSLLAATMAWPLVLSMLARSRREARVHRGHLLRAAVYSLTWLQIALLFRLLDAIWAFADLGIRLLSHRPARGPWGFAPIHSLWDHAPLGRALLLGWLLLWWYWALRRGFRLERAPAIWALLAVISVLVAVLVELSLMPTYLWWKLG